ncbi:hypothetical protein TBR22_A32810 [Luteitalea sp. TBR-22]|uniref:hypothetical protein n=1 Tax=Luteitalea sp. TBR-22 TaxID=2802971 RepID=UPI001AF72E45|nr:hypothetical protein [Luteitalea sp. TBR-22]BCS34052.1 hypothetical protein TBR22_A32810 [Luteitalea sp. TBR-22]
MTVERNRRPAHAATLPRALAATALLLMLPYGVAAQTGGQAAAPPATAAPSASDLAKQTQNPIASLISVPIQGNWDMGVGDRGATGTLVNVQPVMPFAISKSTNVILRVIMPLLSQPLESGGPRLNGMGDVVLSTFFSPSAPSRVIWGVGPVMLLPTATNGALGSEKFGIGPTAVALVQPGNWTIGMLANQIWSTSGAADRSDINTTYLQPFVNYNLGNGVAVGVSAEATANWKADGDTWSSPLLFSLSKVTLLGKRPVNFSMAAGPTFGPDAGPDWRFRFAAVLLFPR